MNLHAAAPAPERNVFYSRNPDHARAADLAALCRAFGTDNRHDGLMAQLLDTSRLVQCRPGYLQLSTPRRPEPSWWLLRSGRLVLGTHRADGSFVERVTVHAGQWLDTGGALSGDGSWLEDAHAPVPFELLAVPVDALAQACAREPDFALAMLRVTAAALREQHLRCDDMVAVDATARVARWLLRLADQQPAAQAWITLRLNERKRAVAQRLNMQSETFSRSLAELRRAGVAQVDGYNVLVPDLQRLRTVAFPARRREGPPATRPLRSESDAG